jgi:hypothetical protein
MRWRDIRFDKPTKEDGAIFCKDTSGGCEYLCSWDEVGHDSIWIPISELPQPDFPGPIPDGWRPVNKALDAFRDDAKCWAGMSYGWSQTLNTYTKEYSTDRDYIVPIDPPAPQYRPFVSDVEFMPHAGKHWRYKNSSAIMPPVTFTPDTHNSSHWGASLEEKEFVDLADGKIVATPFGVLVLPT